VNYFCFYITFISEEKQERLWDNHAVWIPFQLYNKLTNFHELGTNDTPLEAIPNQYLLISYNQ